MRKYLLFVFTVLLLYFSCQPKKSDTLFDRLNSDRTGITFNNEITENDSMNILDYEYVYNGGGVAIADFNQDGNQDVFFTGNMVTNQLYLNQGDLSMRMVGWICISVPIRIKITNEERIYYLSIKEIIIKEFLLLKIWQRNMVLLIRPTL